MLALPILAVSHPTTIVGGIELNFCVRDGNRWTLDPINTNFSSIQASFCEPCSIYVSQVSLKTSLLYYAIFICQAVFPALTTLPGKAAASESHMLLGKNW